MPAIKFDGTQDRIVAAPGACVTTTNHTWVIVMRKAVLAAWSGLASAEGAPSTSTVRTSVETDAINPSKLDFGTQATSLTGTVTTNVSSATTWYGLAVAKSSTTAHLLARRDLSTPGAITNETISNTIAFVATQALNICFGLWNGTDDFNGWLAAVGYFNGALSLAQITECFANRRTSDIWNCSFGHPAALWEFNVAPASVVDVTGGGANWTSTTGNPTLDAAETPPWTYDGKGVVARPKRARGSNVAVQRSSTWCKKRKGILVPDLWLPTPARV